MINYRPLHRVFRTRAVSPSVTFWIENDSRQSGLHINYVRAATHDKYKNLCSTMTRYNTCCPFNALEISVERYEMPSFSGKSCGSSVRVRQHSDIVPIYVKYLLWCPFRVHSDASVNARTHRQFAGNKTIGRRAVF